MSAPINRNEIFLSAIAEGESNVPAPITRKEQYLYKMATGSGDVPEYPITREEEYLAEIAEHGGGVTVEALSVTENGTYTADEGKAYSPVVVNVPNPSAGSIEITQNGTYDVTEKASAVVNVSGGGVPARGILETAWTGEGYPTAITLYNLGNLPDNFLSHSYVSNIPLHHFNKLQSVSISGTKPYYIGKNNFYNLPNFSDASVQGLARDAQTIEQSAFSSSKVTELIFDKINSIKIQAFAYCDALTKVTFNKTPSSIHQAAFYGDTSITEINVPWAENEVAGAPWGATNATINYNYGG